MSLKRVISSSAANGSSISSSRGLVTSPRAIETRIFMPPESSRGIAFSKPVRCTRSSISRIAGAALLARDAAQPQRQPDIVEHIRPGQQRRLLEDEADVGAARSASPRQSSRPVVGVDRPAMMRSAVDLPQPDGPSRLRKSPSPDRQVDIAQRGDAVGEGLSDVAQDEQRVFRCPCPSLRPAIRLLARTSCCMRPGYFFRSRPTPLLTKSSV